MIHQYKFAGRNIVIDVYSGSVHIVDDLAYDLIALFEGSDRDACLRAAAEKHPSASPEDVAECYDQIAALKKSGRLFAPDAFQDLPDPRADGVVKALCLHVAHCCNLQCSYCFAGQGRYRGKSALMSYEVGKQALDFLAASSGDRRNLEVDFFGGEPLMNFDVVKRLTEYARGLEKTSGKVFRFTLTTNGMLIDDDVIDFVRREMSNVVLSLDGRREVHDRFRVDSEGRGSWERIVPKFQKLVSAMEGKSYYIRGTFTHHNPDFLEDIRQMLDLGFTRLSMEPVVCSPDDPSALTYDDLPTVMEQYEKLALLMLERRREGRPFIFYHYMLDLAGGPCIYKRVSGCGSGSEYMAVTPSGELYPCHQFVGDERFRMGDVRSGVTNADIRREFASCSVYSRPECADCWAKLYCSGGCAANAWRASGSIRGVYAYGCELFRKRIECAVALAAAEQLSEA
ncbi:MAG: thioether cross-link-forming SCIFF peptide maturase [Oscillospiraceae bacterium]|jgi:uncharacterized protein|nr:thioether cross-link-forming SCIFF peptide maturase [Oscillospiraceae bacterium]